MESAELIEIRNLLRPHGLDLGSYSDSFLQRRLLIRMRQHKVSTIGEYRNLLVRDIEERRRLAELLSVTVTEFFRDEMFTDKVLDPLFAKIVGRAGRRLIQAWSAGCATGQEPYSLAFLLDSYLNAHGRPCAFRIFATDINENNLKIAAAGSYPKAILTGIPARYQKFFIELDGKANVAAAIRSLIEFKRADLCDAPPFSNLDLIFCRNVMIYLTPEAKTQILKRFHAALAPGAFLVLGASEIVLEPLLFKPLDTRHKIYERV
jgi:two-component system, chemotaxis family, CheB/CheR fusion protein